MPETILVTGGTGTVGRLIAQALRAKGVRPRIASRSPSSVDEVRFDWHDTATFDPALDGVGAVYLVAPTDTSDHLPVMRPLLDRAIARGIGPLVLQSASSLDPGGPMMGAVHGWLRDHAPRWMVLRPTWFMQNFVGQHLPGILADGCIYSATGDGRVAFIDAADIASVAAEALTDPEFPNGDVVLTGAAALRYDDVADAIARASGRTVRHCRLDVATLAERHRGKGLPADYARTLAAMDAAIAEGAEDRTTDAVRRLTGREPTTFAAFAARHRDSFAGRQ